MQERDSAASLGSLQPSLAVNLDSGFATNDRFGRLVAEWQGGCMLCGSDDVVAGLPGCEVDLGFPLCHKHLRWALASRRERMGRQSRRLKLLLLAWCRLRDRDRDAALRWLGY